MVVAQSRTSKQISQFFTAASSTSTDVTKAEVMVTNFLIQHNLPIATAGHLGPLFKTISQTAKVLSHMPAVQGVMKGLPIILCFEL